MRPILTPRSVRLALTYDIDPLLGLIRLSRTHHPTFAEWSGFLESVLMDPAFEPGLSILDDRREDRMAPLLRALPKPWWEPV